MGDASTELGPGLKGQATAAAIVGGTVSQIGGEFSNGDITGASGNTFNQWLSQQRAAALQARAEQQRIQRLQHAIQRQAAEPYISYEGRQALMLSGATVLGVAGTATLPVPVVSGPLRLSAAGIGGISVVDSALSGQPFLFDAAVLALTVSPAAWFRVPVQYDRAFTAAQGVAGAAYSGYAIVED